MDRFLRQSAPGVALATVLVLLLSLLAACGGPAPTIIVVVTSTFTPQPVEPAATSTATVPDVSPTPTPLPPTDRPTIQFVIYEHPSAAFRVEVPAGSDVQADEDSAVFMHDESLVMLIFTVPEIPMDGETLQATIPAIVDDALVGEGLIDAYSELEIEVNEAGDAAGGRMDIVSQQFGNGEGEILLWQVDHVLYMAILLTPDYGQAKAFWVRVMDTLTPATANVPLQVASPEPPPPTATFTPAPVQPSPTPRPAPSATPRPAPTATNTVPPPPPPPTSNQGCYLIQSEIPAELTITFTAQDRQWNDSIKVPANGEKEYCLDPGRYTYTIDAPPPWGSTNGELVVNAGDRLRWPIRAG